MIISIAATNSVSCAAFFFSFAKNAFGEKLFLRYDNGASPDIPPMADLSPQNKKERDDNARFDAVFGHWPAFVGYLEGPEFVIKFANAYLLDFIGNKKIIGKKLLEAFPEIEGQGFFAVLKESFSQGKPHIGKEMHVKVQIENKEREFYVNAVFQPIRNDAEETVGVLFNAVEVTEQVEARKKAEESERRLTMALDAGEMAVWDYDIVNDALVRTARYDQIFGYETDILDWKQDIFWQHVIPEDREMARQAQAIGRETGKLHMQVRIQRKDGSIHWVSIYGQMIYDANKKPLRMIGTIRDITARKKAEEEAEKAAAIINLSEDAIMSMSLDGTITSWNRGAECLYGYTPEEIIGRHINILLPEDHRSDFPEFVSQILAGQKVEHFETERLTKEGKRIHVSITVSPMKDSSGKITGISKIARDITPRIEAEEALRHLALHDALTGLPNRKSLEERIDLVLSIAKRKHQLVAIMFVDIDRFKQINDSLGHRVGDTVLKELSERMKKALAEEDTVARVGGDEFVIMITEITRAEEALLIADQILQSLEAPITVDNKAVHLSGSIGIALYPNDGNDHATLLRNADIAAYRAKESGRNRYQLYDETMNAEATERFALGNDLRGARERGELEVFYQPIVDVRVNKVSAVEALLRWRHPVYGLVFPSEFIPIAEEIGLIHEIGMWTLRAACEQHVQWLRAGHPPMRVAVNLSPIQFSSEKIVSKIENIIRDTGIDPSYLELEITESVSMGDAEHTRQKLLLLKKMGLGITMDDFGTGYSSLSYLRSFPLDNLKIDKSFVRKGFLSSQDSKIIRTIVAMAHNMSLRVSAEGVETVEQLHFLKSLRCYRMQGFLFSKALPPQEFIEWSKAFVRHKR